MKKAKGKIERKTTRKIEIKISVKVDVKNSTTWKEKDCIEQIYSIVDDENINECGSKNKNKIENKNINQWSNIICEACMNFLYSKMLPQKYIISCYILKNTKTETTLRFSTYWDKADKHLQICWPHDLKNCNMLCYLNVYIIKILDGH
ncbi:dynein light chain Tctex-type [Plasmodium brasilianum]|uniref:Dynein light chain Tctex-type n=1 Tax=Plasmodium brasilianum TaxID=5824 RepID=A0ACB9Y785_PLABR|nr:dynein light chain Tctex-type [Plasmodium brasilianum]